MNSIDTTEGLLDKLRDPRERTVWLEFDARYRPLLRKVAHHMGLDSEEAADATQETLIQLLKGIQEKRLYLKRESLRAWLLVALRHRAIDCIRKRKVRRRERGHSVIDHLPGKCELASIWDKECRQRILREALSVLDERSGFSSITLQAFEQVVLRERSPKEVALEMSISVEDVYLAKHRCAKRLREIVSRIATNYEVQDLITLK